MLRSQLPVRYCKANNGMSIAWSSIGEGPPLVLASMIFSLNTAFVPGSPLQHFLDIARNHRLIVYDGLGSGLSDRGFDRISVQNSVADLRCVIDAAGLDSFALISEVPGTQVALQYAATHPAQVERLIVVGGAARGLLHRDPTPEQIAQREAMLQAIEAGWDIEMPAYRLLNPLSAMPDAPPQDQVFMADWFKQMVGKKGFIQFMRETSQTDVSEFARDIQCPAMIFTARHVDRIPFEEGRRLASLIPKGQLVPLQGRNIFPIRGDPGYAEFIATATQFLGAEDESLPRRPAKMQLTPRETDVLELIAHGLDNSTIASRLGVSEKTVRNNITPIFQKIDVKSRARAIVVARQAGFGRGQSKIDE